MNFTINIEGQVRQIKLSKTKALWPLFETVVNSIQSLEDTNEKEKRITIEAIRETQFQLNMSADEKIDKCTHFEEFIITDNGNGFNTENYNSFLEAYSQLKVKKGCKGIGRFLWLKAFDEILIDSTYYENEKWFRRRFSFSLSGINSESNYSIVDNNQACFRKTVVHLKGYKSEYRELTPCALENLARKIIEHCLPYFIIGNCPEIVLKDSVGDTLTLNKYYDNTYIKSVQQEPLVIKNTNYTLYHMLLSDGADKHELHLCANSREVKSIDLSKKIPNMNKRIEKSGGNMFYVGYLTGDYLDKSVNTERSEFNFSELPLINDTVTASEEEIIDSAVGLIKIYLHDDLQVLSDEKKKQIDRLVRSKKPQYRYLLNQRPQVYDLIPSGLSDEKLDLELYHQQQIWEFDTFQKKQAIDEKIKNDATTDCEFEVIFKEYCKNITELSCAGLAEYVIRRKAVIELLTQALESDENGKYSKEARIHSIICPMQASSDEVPLDNMNLWLIDDRLAYHHYLASDQKMNVIPDLVNDSDNRMDLAIFDAALSYTSDPSNISSITIVELKRPMRNDSENDPVSQVLRYVKNIKEGKVKKKNGRDFGDVSHVSFYCYIIGDLTPSMCESAENAGLTKTQDNQGYFGYNPSRGAYVEVISYDKLVKDARQKNQALFDKLFTPKSDDLLYPEIFNHNREDESF